MQPTVSFIPLNCLWALVDLINSLWALGQEEHEERRDWRTEGYPRQLDPFNFSDATFYPDLEFWTLRFVLTLLPKWTNEWHRIAEHKKNVWNSLNSSRQTRCLRASTASGSTLTYEARGGRIGLDVLLSVALNHIPESPHVAGVQDVEELVGMGPAVLHVRPEQVVVGTAVPLRKRERAHIHFN